MNLETLFSQASQYSGKTVAVAAAEDSEVIEAVIRGVNQNLASFSLFGDQEKVTHLLRKLGEEFINHRLINIIHTKSIEHSAEKAVKAVNSGQADVLMKGMVPTSILLKPVLNKEYGLRTGNVLSHLAVFEIEGYDRLILLTDAGMNISPGLEQKRQIINNAVQVARSIGIEIPKVASLAAVEVINPDMQATMDSASLVLMNRRGQIENCIIDGPLALDNAISIDAARQKGISGEVPGRADILLVPNIETGNTLYKSMVYFAKAKVGGIIAGAKAPIVLTSRSDSADSKLYSLALAVCSSA